MPAKGVNWPDGCPICSEAAIPRRTGDASRLRRKGQRRGVARGGSSAQLLAIAYHAVFFTHLYLGQTVDDFHPWEKHRDGVTDLWADENPAILEAYSRADVLRYIDSVDKMIDDTVDRLDLESEITGIPWYKDMGKLEHEILNIRHLQTHVGQLSELLMANGIDGDYWNSRG